MQLDHCRDAVHAEYNALANALVPAFGATLYVVGPRPVCVNCADRLRENGVTNIKTREGVATLDSLAREIAVWQASTFPSATALAVAEHLRREAEELAVAPSNPEEMADLFHLLVAAATASGYDLVSIVASKFAINQTRRWQAPDEMGVVEHVREVHP